MLPDASGSGTTGFEDVGERSMTVGDDCGDSESFLATSRVLPPSVESSSFSSNGDPGSEWFDNWRARGEILPFRNSFKLMCAFFCSAIMISCRLGEQAKVTCSRSVQAYQHRLSAESSCCLGEKFTGRVQLNQCRGCQTHRWTSGDNRAQHNLQFGISPASQYFSYRGT